MPKRKIQWYRSGPSKEVFPFEVVEERLTKKQADLLAREYRAEGWLARHRPKCGYQQATPRKKCWFVAICQPRYRKARYCDL
jgi:hypothetical protein